jgi:alpha-tubulin suppressor-like RCC1 family protein
MREKRIGIPALPLAGLLVIALVASCSGTASPAPLAAPTALLAAPTALLAAPTALLAAPTALLAAPTAPPSTASPPAVSPVSAPIAAGEWHTCALTGSGGVKCWGHNYSGQLGDGSTIDSSLPVDVSGLASGVVAVAAGGLHACALTSEGGVKCWGLNERGQLGNGTTTDSSVPVDVSGLAGGVVAVDAGVAHTCALTSEGGVKCWGWNAAGELGNGSTIDSSLPVDVSGLAGGVSAIAAGAYHTCALTNGGGVKCWGAAPGLGNGTTTSSSVPVDVPGLSRGVTAIAASLHTCALTSGGGVKCWGPNAHGKLGDGTRINSYVPVEVSGLAGGVSAIAVGGQHTCAVAGGGGVKCWGYNGYGQIGDVSTTASLTPVGVSGVASGVTAIAAGGLHTCALTGLGEVRCWGRNTYGQLGNGTRTNSRVPVEVDLTSPSP